MPGEFEQNLHWYDEEADYGTGGIITRLNRRNGSLQAQPGDIMDEITYNYSPGSFMLESACREGSQPFA